MRESTECSLVRDLLPLSIEGLVSEESAKLIQAHLEICKKCGNYREELLEDKKEREDKEQAIERRFVRTLKKWRYEMLGLFIGVFVVLGVVLLLLFNPFSAAGQGEEVYTVKEHYEDVQDYGKQNYTGIAGLSLFPESDAVSTAIQEFYYDCKGQKLYQAYQIYLKCVYEEDAYEAEKQRLLQVTDEFTGRGIVYSEKETYLPCISAMLYDEGFEYALLDEAEYTIIYIYLQGIDRREVVFNNAYLPADYGQAGYYFETEREAFRIYPTEWEKMNEETKSKETN